MLVHQRVGYSGYSLTLFTEIEIGTITQEVTMHWSSETEDTCSVFNQAV